LLHLFSKDWCPTPRLCGWDVLSFVCRSSRRLVWPQHSWRCEYSVLLLTTLYYSVLCTTLYYSLILLVYSSVEQIIDGGELSALQLEAIIYSCQRHETILPCGERAGYLIGDGAGVGKGRTVAGVIYENYLCGRKRALWWGRKFPVSV